MALLDFLTRAQTQKVTVPNAKQYLLDKVFNVNKVSFDTKRAELNSTVFTCINIISNTISKCDLEIYQTVDGRKEKAVSHRWYNTVRFQPDNRLSTKKFLLLFESNYQSVAGITRTGKG